jgi:hypothetical protein
MPASLWTETVTWEPSVAGTLDQTGGLKAVRAITNQRELRSVFSIMAHTSKMEARIGQDRGYLNAGWMANGSFGSDEISADASNG